MQSIKAKYDGKNIIFLQPPHVNEEYDVIVTFVEPVKKSETTEVKIESGKLPRSSAYGLWKGKIKMAPDFDEPLECMKEYME